MIEGKDMSRLTLAVVIGCATAIAGGLLLLLTR
jgi:hypothetical protein